jgi:hypothetical protein
MVSFAEIRTLTPARKRAPIERGGGDIPRAAF